MSLTKGHNIRNTGRTHFKSGITPWNKGGGLSIVCIVCGKEKYFALNQHKKGEKKYCSAKCYHEDAKGKCSSWNKGKSGYTLKRKGKTIICVVCGTEKYYEANEHKKRERKYCSPKCYHKDTEKEILSYSGLHNWIKREYGKAERCEECGATEYVDWANISQTYIKDISDWKQLCRKHHIAFDKKVKAENNLPKRRTIK